MFSALYTQFFIILVKKTVWCHVTFKQSSISTSLNAGLRGLTVQTGQATLKISVSFLTSVNWSCFVLEDKLSVNDGWGKGPCVHRQVCYYSVNYKLLYWAI